jgi:hypothetical protein
MVAKMKTKAALRRASDLRAGLIHAFVHQRRFRPA